MRGDQNFMLTAGSDEDALSLVVGPRRRGRVVTREPCGRAPIHTFILDCRAFAPQCEVRPLLLLLTGSYSLCR
jgi:hypothetical protein